MKDEEDDEREERISTSGKPKVRWFYVDPITHPLSHSEDGWHQEMNKTFFRDVKLKEKMTATYWGDATLT